MPLYGWRGRIGVIMPSNNTVLEPELYAYLPPGVSLHGARVIARGSAPADRVSVLTEGIPRALAELQGKVGVFCYACMTSSVLKPVGWHGGLAAAGGVPFLPAGETMVQALQQIAARRIGVFSTFPAAVAAQVAPWFAPWDIQVLQSANIPVTPDTVGARTCQELYPVFRREFRPAELDAFVILGTDLATFDVIDSLEADLGIPVISSNMAILWSALAALGVRGAGGPGRLFRLGGA